MCGRRFIPEVVSMGEVPRPERRPVILVVDDETAITDTLTEILNRSGYATMKAYDGEEALQIALMTPPNLLITDVILPGMTGIELAITVGRIYPDCKSLLCSGQSIALELQNCAASEGHRFTLLTKPVHPTEILARVAEYLGPPRVVSPGSVQDQRSDSLI